MKARGFMDRTVTSVMFILLLSLAAQLSYGNDNEEKPHEESIAGMNAEVSETRNRDIVNVGFFSADRDGLLHAGIFSVKTKGENARYGVDIGSGVPFPVYRLWPFVELGVKISASSNISNVSAELYPKIGVAVLLSDQTWIYAGYLYSFSTQGRNSDYSAASFGFVWAM
jgi:hypothetical protein